MLIFQNVFSYITVPMEAMLLKTSGGIKRTYGGSIPFTKHEPHPSTFLFLSTCCHFLQVIHVLFSSRPCLVITCDMYLDILSGQGKTHCCWYRCMQDYDQNAIRSAAILIKACIMIQSHLCLNEIHIVRPHSQDNNPLPACLSKTGKSYK